MKIIFKIEEVLKEQEKNESSDTAENQYTVEKVSVFMPYEDEGAYHADVSVIVRHLNELATELNKDETKRVRFISLWGSDDKIDSFYHGYFEILVRLKNGIPDEILSTGKYLYNMRDMLKKEAETKDKTYTIFEISGTLKGY